MKNLQKTGFLWQFLFNFDGFSQFLQFCLNLSAPTYQSGTSVWSSRFFDTPGTPGGTSIVEWNEFWSFRSLFNEGKIFLDGHKHWRNLPHSFDITISMFWIDFFKLLLYPKKPSTLKVRLSTWKNLTFHFMIEIESLG